jgi:hypothetical protein
MSQKEVPVVCHDFRSIVTGNIREISDTGCELVSSIQSTGPVFAQKANVLLNLLDEKTGRSVNVSARLTAVKRHEGKWTYRIRWSSLPDFLSSAA